MSYRILLNLVVIRSADLNRAAGFYEQLGMRPVKERHGDGPEHYSAQLGSTVFEIYPLDGRPPSASSVRLGFRVTSLDRLVERLVELGARVPMPPRMTAWGRRAVVEDFDGYRIELTETDEDQHLLDE
ncbi:MAG TPA: VOC family protein [Blastocatellia bacterium]|nr:VOC family protein [Blastocatellia bacterium]